MVRSLAGRSSKERAGASARDRVASGESPRTRGGRRAALDRARALHDPLSSVHILAGVTNPEGPGTGLLGTMVGALATILGVVFSLTIVALQLASTQYTSRPLSRFMADRLILAMSAAHPRVAGRMLEILGQIALAVPQAPRERLLAIVAWIHAQWSQTDTRPLDRATVDARLDDVREVIRSGHQEHQPALH